ncbi:hypothetical protein SAMN05414139_04535 [Burkholderia sp. D7]|nr:hypothetical protein SAMN05414139_04535 [Burkholderia sp. D7]
MPVFDLFSKRQRLRRGEVPDVYTYDVLPPALRVQMIHIITDAFGKDLYSSTHAQKAYKLVHDILCREYGEFELVKHQRNQTDGVVRFIGEEKSVERVLDAVEVSCRVMERIIAGKSRYEEASRVPTSGAVFRLCA